MSLTFVVVLLARLLVPLGIPRFPLPAIIAALVVDGVDQTLFQQFGGLPEDYQSYDKALDIYYLAVAYASTLRNWQDPFAFEIGRFLWYYRLVGVVLFELTGARALLLIFPNTFEYFFIAYEALRVCWNPARLGRRGILVLAAGIWVFVKLPQEWWIHIAQLDVTDELRAHSWALPTLVALGVAVLVVLAACWRRLPRPDWPPTVSVDSHLTPAMTAGPSPLAVRSLPFLATVGEKVVLLGLISVIFAEVLHVTSTHTQIVVAVALLVVTNAAISQYFARRGTHWATTTSQFAAMLAVNALLVTLYALNRHRLGTDVNLLATCSLLLILSLNITLYDRYRTMRERNQSAGRGGGIPYAP